MKAFKCTVMIPVIKAAQNNYSFSRVCSLLSFLGLTHNNPRMFPSLKPLTDPRTFSQSMYAKTCVIDQGKQYLELVLKCNLLSLITEGEESYTSESAEHLTQTCSVREIERGASKKANSWLLYVVHSSRRPRLGFVLLTPFIHNLTECVTNVTNMEVKGFKPDKQQ